MNVEKRESARKTLRIKATLTIDEGKPMPVDTTDIGKFGMCLVNLRQPIAMGQHVRIAFEVLFSGAVHKVDVGARVAYCYQSEGEGYKVGVQFLNLDSDGALLIAQYIGH